MFGKDWGNVYSRNHGRFIKQLTHIKNLHKDENLAGVIPRSINKLFRYICSEKYINKQFNVYCSFLQIYKEKIYDLLTVSFFTINNTIE